MKKYKITEKGIETIVEANSKEKALCSYFGVEKVCKQMGSGEKYGNMRYSKTRSEIYRSATISQA